MSLDIDKFIISILFDDKKTGDSATKIEDKINDMKNKILKGFGAIASFAFLENAVKSSVELATKMDNLSYVTNVSKENLQAWGEAVKRNGGSTDAFYTSISNLAAKIRDIQTNLSPATYGIFQRFGLALHNANGHIKNAAELLTELSSKFQHLPKAFQFSLGHALGLDDATIRLLAQGNQQVQALVEKMTKLGGLNALNTERNIKLRNSLYDLQLIWQNISLHIANRVIPLTTAFTEHLITGFQFLQRHSAGVRAAITALSLVISVLLIKSILELIPLIAYKLIPDIINLTKKFWLLNASMLANPMTWWAAGLLAAGLILQDFIVYLRGGNSEFGKFYDLISKTTLGQGLSALHEKFVAMRDIVKETLDLMKEFWNFSFPNNKIEGNANNTSNSATYEDIRKNFSSNGQFVPENKKSFSTMFAPITNPYFSPQSSAADIGRATKSQINNSSSKTVNQKSVTVGEIKINAPNSNAREIASNINEHLQKHFTALVTNIDNGVLA
jgi:hypothetical protein